MHYLQRKSERGFEKLISIAIRILSNPFTFLISFVTIVFWLSNKLFYAQDSNDQIGDIISGISFLSLLIIQRSFTRFSASLHLKINELVKSHDGASNSVINIEEKTDREIVVLINDYGDLGDPLKTEEEKT